MTTLLRLAGSSSSTLEVLIPLQFSCALWSSLLTALGRVARVLTAGRRRRKLVYLKTASAAIHVAAVFYCEHVFLGSPACFLILPLDVDPTFNDRPSLYHGRGKHYMKCLACHRWQRGEREGMAAEVACACAGETEEEEARAVVGEAAAIRALNTAVELHLEKTMEKKRAVDAQKKEMWRLFQLFFLFLAVLFAAQLGAPQDRLQCRHCWVPIALLALGHLAFSAAAAQTLRCIHGCKYQRRCHKLTLALATDRLKLLTTRCSAAAGPALALLPGELEIHYQKPPESYLRKFNRSWAVHVGFLICTFGFMVSSTVVVLCF